MVKVKNDVFILLYFLNTTHPNKSLKYSKKDSAAYEQIVKDKMKKKNYFLFAKHKNKNKNKYNLLGLKINK